MFRLKSNARLATQIGLCIFLIASSLNGYAQAVFGSLYGTAADTSGAAIPNAKITVTDEQKGITKTTQSNASGAWTVDHLVPDTYTIKVEADGFAPAQAEHVVVHADVAQQVQLGLGAQGSSTTVNVSASDIPLLKTDRADVAMVLDEQSVQNLPNLNRNFTQFTLLTPGVQHSTFNQSGAENPQGGLAVTTNGSSYGVQGWLLDGTDNREPVLGIVVVNPTLDSISEMKVTSSNYDAEFGGAVGGIVSAQTKSGGNAIHGDVFYFRHSDAQSARNPFTQSTRDSVTNRFIPSQLYSQFGGSLGGPIIKDKTFYFMDYQGTRQRLGQSLLLTVPTQLVRNTCLSGTTACDLSQYSSGPKTIARTALSQQGVNILNLLPAPNTNGTSIVNNYQASGSGSTNSDQADLRIDHQYSDHIHLFGRYDYASYRLQGDAAFGAGGGEGFGSGNSTGTAQVQNQSGAAGVDWVVSPSLMTDVRFGYLNYHVAENKLTAGTTPATAAGIANLNVGADSTGLPAFNVTDGSISNFGNQGCNCPLLESEQVYQLANNWTKTLGNHTIKFGGDIRYAFNLRNASDNDRAGVLSFSNSTSGLGLSSVLLGEVARFQRYDVYNQTASNRQKRGAFYAQDSWRVSQKLQLNYGVRWNMIFPETVNTPGAGGFADLSAGGIRVAGIGGNGTNGGQLKDFTNFEGRFGFAYKVSQNTVLRGGIGQVYDSVGFFGTIFGSVLTHNLPVLNNEDAGSTSQSNAEYSLSAMPAKPSAPSIPSNGIIPFSNSYSPQFRPHRMQLPLVDQWNLTLQQQLSNSMSFTIAYVGNHAERIYPGETYGYDLNAPTLPTTQAQLGNLSERRPYYNRFNSEYEGATVTCCSNSLTSAAPSANANYHSLQTMFEKRYANGLQFNANYTWSKAMNYSNTEAFANYPGLTYGRNDTNRTNVFVLSGLYDLPFGRERMFASHVNRLVDYAIGGWTISGDTTWESGRPFTPTYAECGSDEDLDTNYGSPGSSSDCRPDKTGTLSSFTSTGSLDPTSHSVRFFTPVSALSTNGAVSGPFVRPSFGTIGNIGRNSLMGPKDFYADASLIKTFSITERVKGQFQFQLFNLFNHAALDIPTASSARCIDCSTGGTITTLEGNTNMRQIQFAGKITF